MNQPLKPKTHFDILGLAVDASYSEITNAYHKLKADFQHNPSRLNEIETAYVVLSNPVRRYNYELQLTHTEPEVQKRRRSQPSTEIIEVVSEVQKRRRSRPLTEIIEVVSDVDFQDRASIRRWWHRILRTHGRYSCYAVFLVLPSDREAIRYITEFGRELYLISGKNCLIIGMSKTELRHFGFNEKLWSLAIEEQVFEGYSLEVAQLFNIPVSEFPCLVVFQDIRSSDYIKATFSNMLASEIAEKMRLLFSAINDAITKQQNPLLALERQRNNEEFKKAGNSIISGLQSFAGKTFETVIEAVIKAIIK